MKTFLLNICFVCLSVLAMAQEKTKEKFFKKYPFVNMTEIGGLFGRVQNPTYYYYYRGGVLPPINETYTMQNRVSISLQTFNGVYLTKQTAVGLTTGIDWYNAVLLMPIQMGVRQTLIQKGEHGSSIYAGLDGGYATTWFNADNSNYDTKGGVTVSPTIGFKLPMRGGSSWLINFGYKYQRVAVDQTNEYDPYWSSHETRNYNRLVVKMGLEL